MFHTYNFIYAFYVGHNLSLFITGIIVIIIHSTFMLVLSKLSIFLNIPIAEIDPPNITAKRQLVLLAIIPPTGPI